MRTKKSPVITKPKSIKTPSDMWGLFEAYKIKTKSNPILKHDFVGRQGKSVNRKLERPLTMQGFNNYCMAENVIRSTRDYFDNRDARYSEFKNICHRIKQVIRQDQIEGGMAGIYNPSITQRLQGLVYKTENTVVEQPLFLSIKEVKCAGLTCVR